MKIEPYFPASLLAAKLSVLPASKEKKYPTVGSWKTYQERLPTEFEVETWFAKQHDALCLVCGKVSGNLEVIDFDHGGELFESWKSKIPAEILNRVLIEKTPSGVWNRTTDLQVMSLISYHCSTPHYCSIISPVLLLLSNFF